MSEKRRQPTVVSGIERLDAGHGPAFIVVGVFDGLHLGHAYLIRHLVRLARRRDARATVITFDHHPDEILVGRAPALLLDPAERLHRLAAAGVETTVVVPFDAALRATEYDEFIHRIAVRTPIAGFLMTPDAAFGHDRRGTPAAVSALGAELGFEVVVVPPFSIDGEAVTSTAIRAAIAAGDLGRAEHLLGRPVAVVGTAAPDGTGARVAFELPVALPPPGIHDVVARSDGSRGVRSHLTIGRDETTLDRPIAGRVRIDFS